MADDRVARPFEEDLAQWRRWLLELAVVVGVLAVLAVGLAAALSVSLLIQILRGPGFGVL